MRTIRARPGPVSWAVCAIPAGMFIAAGVYWRGQAPALLACAALGAVVIWVRVRAARLEITDSTMRVKERLFAPEKEAARSDITAIHYFPGTISFRGPDDKPMMRIATNWTVRQMLDVAGELGVPLYDHRGWLGLRKVRIGRLLNPPAPRDPVR